MASAFLSGGTIALMKCTDAKILVKVIEFTISRPDKSKTDISKFYENVNCLTNTKINQSSYIQWEQAITKQAHTLEE